MPAAGVYFVLPERIAASAAWQIWSGVGKSGSPTERSTTLTPAAAIAEARAAIASVQHLPRGPVARVLVVGGSQGSEFLNQRVPGLLKATGVALEVRHQVGKLDPAPVAQAYAEAGIAATVESFIDDMAAAYAWADLAVTRSGSGTVSELAAAGVPALLVPFPFAAGDHQAWNARAFAQAGAGHWVRQQDWQEAALADQLRRHIKI